MVLIELILIFIALWKTVVQRSQIKSSRDEGKRGVSRSVLAKFHMIPQTLEAVLRADYAASTLMGIL